MGALLLATASVVLSCGSASEDSDLAVAGGADSASASESGDVNPCSEYEGGFEVLCEDEMWTAAKRAVRDSDLDVLREVVREFPSFSEGERGATLFAFSVCQPDAASMMIVEWGYDVTAVVDGSGAVRDLLGIDRGIDGSILQPRDLAGEVMAANGCEDPAAVYETLRLVLDAGASPCAAPVDDPGLSPVLAAGDAGWEPAVTEILLEYTDQC